MSIWYYYDPDVLTPYQVDPGYWEFVDDPQDPEGEPVNEAWGDQITGGDMAGTRVITKTITYN